MDSIVKPKNEIEKRMGQFVYLKENTDFSQKKIAEVLNVSAATVNGYNNKYKNGEITISPIEVDVNAISNNEVNKKSAIDQELADKRKAQFIYLAENTDLLQKDMAEVIGVSKAAIGKYNRAYKMGKYEGIEPIKPETLDEFLNKQDNKEKVSNEVESGLNEVAVTVENIEPIQEVVEEVVINNIEVQDNNEKTSGLTKVENNINDEKEDLNLNNNVEKPSLKATVVETTLQDASSNDVASFLNLFTNQLDNKNLYDLKITIRKK